MIPALINHLWQSTLFALGAGLLTLALRRNGAAVRYWLWFAASVKFLIPFALLVAVGTAASDRLHLGVALPHPLKAIAPVMEPVAPTPIFTSSHPPSVAPPVTPATVTQTPMSAHHATITRLDPAPILFAVWGLGLAALLTVWGVRWSRIRAALRAAKPTNLPAPISVLSTPVPMEPGVVGLWRQVLIVPDGIAEHLSPSEWSAVLDHELCHIRRRDNLTGAVHMLAQALFWFHPLLWWLGERLIAERERACDEAVVLGGADTHTYAEGILKVCRLYLQQPLVCAAGVSGANLKQRVQRILAGRAAARLGIAKAVMLAGAACLSVAGPLSVGLVASAPMIARAQPIIRAAIVKAIIAPATAPKSAAEGLDNSTDAKMAEAPPTDSAEAVTPSVPPTRPIVLALQATPPAPELTFVDANSAQVSTGLSHTIPDLPVINVAGQAAAVPSDRQPVTAGSWLVLSRLAGQSYYDGDRILRFLPRSDDTFVINNFELGGGRANYGVFVLKRTSPNTAVMLDDHDNQAFASVTLLPDGWIERPLKENRLGRVNRFKLVGDVLWKNSDVVKDGRVLGTGVEKYQRVSDGFKATAAGSAAVATDALFEEGKFQWGQGYRQALGACPRIPKAGMRQEPAAPADAESVKQFFHGVLWNQPDYQGMSTTLARAVRMGIPQVDFPYLRRLAGDPTSVSYLGQRDNSAIYAVQMAGGKARGLVSVNAQGKVEASYLCEGGL